MTRSRQPAGCWGTLAPWDGVKVSRQERAQVRRQCGGGRHRTSDALAVHISGLTSESSKSCMPSLRPTEDGCRQCVISSAKAWLGFVGPCAIVASLTGHSDSACPCALGRIVSLTLCSKRFRTCVGLSPSSRRSSASSGCEPWASPVWLHIWPATSNLAPPFALSTASLRSRSDQGYSQQSCLPLKAAIFRAQRKAGKQETCACAPVGVANRPTLLA